MISMVSSVGGVIFVSQPVYPDGYINFSKFGHLESRVRILPNSYSRNGQKLFKILPKCGEISPNPVTLVPTHFRKL